MPVRRPRVKPSRPARKAHHAAAGQKIARLQRTISAQARQLTALKAKVASLTASQETTGASLPLPDPAYLHTVGRLREATLAFVPEDASVVLVGKAEAELLNLHGRPVWRFPQDSDGAYAGYYPACSTAAIVHLEALRAKGASYLLIPEISRWWLDHYVEFAQYVTRRYPCLLDEAGAGVYFSLRPSAAQRDVWHELDEVLETVRSRGVTEPAMLDWHTGLQLAARLPQHAIFLPQTVEATLPYLDGSIDLVAVMSPGALAAREADRVAASAVLTFARGGGGRSGGPSMVVRWKADAERAALATTSIVIPCFNAVAHTEACLNALGETLPDDFAGEIIVVDDASTDATAARLKRWSKVEKRLRVIRNRSNVGFIRSTNKGAQAAEGDILIFLNNDTIPIAGWLTPLLRVFRDRTDAGAVGGRLVYPSGRLQEAGGVVFRDGSAANFGRDDHNPDLPMYRFLREVDYCSGALLATPRSVFLKLGGFDLHYDPGYYEDTDYCFKLRQNGYRVYLQPETVVMHAEGATAGLDVSRGMKRFQVVNQDKFRQRWQYVLEAQRVRPERFDFTALHALALRHGVNGDGTR